MAPFSCRSVGRSGDLSYKRWLHPSREGEKEGGQKERRWLRRCLPPSLRCFSDESVFCFCALSVSPLILISAPSSITISSLRVPTRQCFIGTPWVSCRFADVHAKTRKSRAEVGQNIITIDSALFKFTVAKISNSDFYSK